MSQTAEKALLRSMRSALAIGALGLSAHAQSATLTVNTTVDISLPGATCSLRKAIDNANANATVHAECPPAGDYGADTILFDPVVFPADQLTASALSGELSLSDASTTTIDGAGAVALDGQKFVRIFTVSGSAYLEGLTISNGYTMVGGGGMLVTGSATIDRCNLKDNVAKNSFGGAIFHAAGQLTVKRSTLSGNGVGVWPTTRGGAIYSCGTGSLTVSDSTLSQNYATSSGGAIDSCGPLTVKDSLVSGNYAYYGGGIRFTDLGHFDLVVTATTLAGNRATFGGGIAIYGALSPPSSTPVLTNDTFHGNLGLGSTFGTTGAAIYNVGNSTPTITNSTFLANAFVAVRSVNAPATLVNSVLAGSAQSNCSTYPSDVGIVDGGGNIDDGTSCGFTAAAGSLDNTDPKLVAPPSDNGGPTPTLALGASSPAFHFASACPDTDQRGLSRPPTHCDAGAYEETVFFNAFE